jgi:hypothetical protein
VKTYGERARALGWEPRKGEDEDARELRRLMLWMVALVGDEPQLAAEAQKRVRTWLDSRTGLDPELVTTALSIAARRGDRALFDRYVAEARKTKDRRERTQLLSALGTFRAPELQHDALALVGGPVFDLRDSLPLLTRAISGRETRELAWSFTQGHFDAMSARMRDDDVLGFLRNVAGAFCDAAHRAELASFFTPRVGRFDGAPRVLATQLEELDLCVEAARRDGPSVTRFLERY